MVEPWFNPNFYAWIPGTVYGVTAGMLGALAGYLAPRGQSRAALFAAFATMIVLAIIFLSLSVYAYFAGQPYGIWYGFGLPGVIGLVVIPSILPGIRQQYRIAEERQMQAKDME